MKEPEDLELIVRRAQRGDAGAFEELVRRFETKVFSIALKLTSNPHDARDAAQETFLRAFRSLASFDPSAGGFGTWLARIAVHCSYDALKERSRFDRGASLDELFDANPGVLRHDPSVGEEERMDRERTFAFLLRTLPELPPQQRSAVVLKDLEGYATDEIAAILGCGEATVRRHLHEGRAKLREAFEKAFPSS